MLYHFEVTEVEIIEDQDAFAEWANASDEQEQDDIDRWEAAYYTEIKSALKEQFPLAAVEVESSADSRRQGQHVELKRVKAETPDTIDIDGNDGNDGWASDYAAMQAEENVKSSIVWVIESVSEKGTFWSA